VSEWEADVRSHARQDPRTTRLARDRSWTHQWSGRANADAPRTDAIKGGEWYNLLDNLKSEATPRALRYAAEVD